MLSNKNYTARVHIKVVFIFLLSLILLAVAAVLVDYYYNKYNSPKEYYYCKLYYDPNLEYYLDKNKIRFIGETDIETNEPIFMYIWSVPIVVEKYEDANTVGFWGLVKYDGKCQMRKYDIAFKDIPEKKELGVYSNEVLINPDTKGKFVPYSEALDLLNVGKQKKVMLFDKENYDIYYDSFCDNFGMVTNDIDFGRDSCAIKKRMEMQFDGFYNFVEAIE